MPTSIPYDSSLTLMSVVNQDALKSVEAIAELQAPVDAAQDALDEELKKLNVAVEAAAGAYATAKMAAEPQITGIRTSTLFISRLRSRLIICASMAEASRTTGQASEMRGKYIESSLSALATIDGEENKILDVNSMMTALDDYLKKAADGKAGIFSTSQNIENLVFGTSETNSLMTRYETA
ncbi:hypothetical protein Forpi1262_v017356 [Fusarium oxysporum f. sp. raphani]|uniref:Uncharacterized protein n=1 Tax=Fusarium oxysporum f. sp. raphani TaxID=96318 RepID=A0A8J5P1V8_FUSOX|nr:hypothetical protein Forpi1262_v017356 [Fusarium oxysporum f. sp. raphani]